MVRGWLPISPTTNHHLKIHLQIHSRIQLRDLIAVAVKHQRVAPPPLAEATFRRLATSRVRELRIDVSVECVFIRRCVAPCRWLLFVGGGYPAYWLDAFDPVLP